MPLHLITCKIFDSIITKCLIKYLSIEKIEDFLLSFSIILSISVEFSFIRFQSIHSIFCGISSFFRAIRI